MNIYKLEIEIFEGCGGKRRKSGDGLIYPDFAKEGICAWMYRGDGERSYRAGDRFRYPEDAGRLCTWLLGSLSGMLHTLQYGGTLPWRYTDTPYEKEIDPEGTTTEYVRCIDPTASGIVVKIIRTRVGAAPDA